MDTLRPRNVQTNGLGFVRVQSKLDRTIAGFPHGEAKTGITQRDWFNKSFCRIFVFASSRASKFVLLKIGLKVTRKVAIIYVHLHAHVDASKLFYLTRIVKFVFAG